MGMKYKCELCGAIISTDEVFDLVDSGDIPNL